MHQHQPGSLLGRLRSERGPLLGLGALVVVLFAEVTLAGRVFYERDIQMIWYPQAEAFARVLRAGSWPLWNPYHSFGQPLLANPNTQVLYLPTWLNLVVRPETYYVLFVLGHSLLTVTGLYLLGRRLAMSRPASFLAAAAWILSGPLLSMVQLQNHFAGAAWLPWTVLAADAAFASRRWGPILLWGLTMAMQVFAGAPELLLAGGLLAAGLALRHVGRPLSWAAARRAVVVCMAAITVGLVLSAAQWLPTLVAARQTARLTPPDALRNFWSVHPLQILEMGLPLELDRLPLTAGLRALLFESREAFLASLYSGLSALALVGAAVVRGRRLSRLLLTVAVIAVLLALGRHTPTLGLAVRVLPVLQAFRHPAKAMVVVSFALALLTGMGLDVWREGGLSRRSRLLLVVLPLAAAVSVCAAGAAVAHGVITPHAGVGLLGMPLQPLLAPAATRLTIAALLGAAMLALLTRGRVGRHGGMAAALVVLDLLAANRDLNRTAPRELFDLRPSPLDLLRVEDRSRLYAFDYALPGRVQRYLGEEPLLLRTIGQAVPWRAAAAARTYLHPFTLAGFGLEGSYAADTILLYPAYLDTLTHAVFDAEETPAELRLLRAGAVSHVVALHRRGFENLVPLAVRPSLYRVPIHVFGVPDPLPRAFAVGTVRVTDDTAALRFLMEGAQDLRAEAVAATGPELRAPPSFVASAAVALWRPDRVRIRVQASAPALVVLVDAFEPGWTVTVDGRSAEPRRVNLAFRGVEVPEGHHQVEWVYRPTSVLVGLLVSGLGVGVVVALAFTRRLSRALREGVLAAGDSPARR